MKDQDKDKDKDKDKKPGKGTGPGKGKDPDTERAMLEIVKTLRENPEKYQSLRKSIAKADSDEERVSTLVRFATSERELASLMPRRASQEVAAAWTTVTVTTVFVLEDSAY